MKTPFHSCSRPARFFGIALSLALSLFVCGALMMPAMAMAATTENPVVAQQPLTIQPPIPPDIVLMLDDSGSMAWSTMPDYSSLSDNSLDGMRDSAVNEVYYNPAVTYSPPPQADSTTSVPHLYSDNDVAKFPNAYSSPFTDTTQTQDVTQATGTYGDSSTTTSEFYPFPFYDDFYKQCDTSGNCSYQLDTLVFTPKVSFAWTKCSADSYSSNNCVSAFAYTTNDGAGYVTHYVASDCTDIPGSNCVDATDTSGTSAPKGVAAGQNVMNWYSYYSTRIKMARSGVMTAFSTLGDTVRVGFGSINGTNNPGLPKSSTGDSLVATYAGTATYDGTTIAQVQQFGDGSTGSQKANLWSWIIGIAPSGSTPLRKALNSVGKYYGGNDSSSPASNAWDTLPGDPNYVAGGTNDTQVACRQAYTILTTDGFWNGTYTSADIAGASDTAGDKNGSAVTGPNNQSYTYNPAAPYSGGGTGTTDSPSLADVAMYYWKNDLQTGIDNEVPTSADDPAFWQHMVTFGMGMGYTPTGISPDSATTDQIFDWANGGTALDGFSWPTPVANSEYNIADLEHAGVNGHGGFYSATNPRTFVSGIEAALNRVIERVGTGASLAANSTQLTTGSVIYQSTYYTSTWKGDLKAFSINSVNGAIAATPTWQASQKMPAAASRDIQTYNPSSDKFVDFKDGSTTTTNPDGTTSTATAPPALSSTQLDALGSDATAQENMVNYLRGDTTNEQQNGGSYRNRDWTLGDIVDSQPVYSGAPDPNEFINQSFLGTIAVTDPNDSTKQIVPFYDWAVGTTSSGTFTASAASGRTPLIFVAANDGMLHAFDASTGAEVYAYLPGAVITNGLKNLADPSYGSAVDPHQFYNDGQLTIADAYIDTGDGSGQSWHTILVGTTGRGPAEAVYALDITNPADIKPLWERSAGDGKADSDYIGQMTGKPVIAQTNYTPASGSTAASSTWSVLMGNGYNSTEGVAALLQFNLATGALTVHTTTDATTGNGLAAPVAWMDNASDGVSDIAYAGDLHGHVWAFQLNDTTGSSGSTYTASTGSLLFTAEDADGKAQPITAGILAGQDPRTSDIWLFFGTGEYLSSTDLTNTDTQTWYGLIVDKCTTSTSNKGDTSTSCTANVPGSRSNLTQRTITAETTGGSGTLPARSVSSEVIGSDGTTDMDDADGWYLDLKGPNATATDPAERMVDPNEFQGTLLIGVTRIPKVTDICNPSGSGWIMAVDPFTGAAPSGDFFDVNNDGYVNAGDRVGGSVAAGVGFSSLPNAPIFVGGIMETSFDNGSMSSITTAGSVGTIKRVNWRELVN